MVNNIGGFGFGTTPPGKKPEKEEQISEQGTTRSARPSSGAGRTSEAVANAQQAEFNAMMNPDALFSGSLADALGLPSSVDAHIAAQNAPSNVDQLDASTLAGLQNLIA